MTPEEARAAWVEALRSGDYEQGKSNLCYRYSKHDEFCCLGVACELAIADGVHIEREMPPSSGAVTYRGRHDGGWGLESHKSYGAALPPEVKDWLGLRDSYGSRKGAEKDGERISLTDMNDGGDSFAQIADALEAEPEQFFDIEATV